MKSTHQAAAGTLIGAFLGLAGICLATPENVAHKAAPEPEPIIALLRTGDGCPVHQLRAIVSFNARETYKFCWRLNGNEVEVLDRDNLVTSMPARWFSKPERSQ